MYTVRYSMIRSLSALLLAASPALAQGIITTYAGSTWVFPNPIPAINAPLGQVYGVATDAAGNVFIGVANDSQPSIGAGLPAGSRRSRRRRTR